MRQSCLGFKDLSIYGGHVCVSHAWLMASFAVESKPFRQKGRVGVEGWKSPRVAHD